MMLTAETNIVSDKFGEEKAVAMLAHAGFDAIDYSQFDLRTNGSHPVLGPSYDVYANRLRKAAEDEGICFRQSHAPFPSYMDGKDSYNSEIFAKIKRSVEVAGILGAKVICVHPVSFPNDEEREFEFNVAFYQSLEPYAKAAGVKIGVENMFWRDNAAGCIRPGACGTAERMIRVFDALNPDSFTCLLDIGHCGLAGESADDFIRKLGGKRLGALHVHDNNFKEDMHTLPFTRGIDWKKVTGALHDVSYPGDFTFEANTFLAPFPDELVPDALSLLCKVGRQLINMIENA